MQSINEGMNDGTTAAAAPAEQQFRKTTWFGRMGTVAKAAWRAVSRNREHVLSVGVFAGAIAVFITAQRRYIASISSSR